MSTIQKQWHLNLYTFIRKNLMFPALKNLFLSSILTHIAVKYTFLNKMNSNLTQNVSFSFTRVSFPYKFIQLSVIIFQICASACDSKHECGTYSQSCRITLAIHDVWSQTEQYNVRVTDIISCIFCRKTLCIIIYFSETRHFYVICYIQQSSNEI